EPEPGEVDLRAAVEVWPAVVAAVSEENAMLATLLGDAIPIAVDDGELTLAFPADAAFLKRKAGPADYRRMAGDTFRSVMGRSLAVRYELGEPVSAAGEQVAAVRAVLTSDEVVQRFVDEFNAEELHDEPAT